MKVREIKNVLDGLVAESFVLDEPTEWDEVLRTLHEDLAGRDPAVLYAAIEWADAQLSGGQDWTPGEFEEAVRDGYKYAQGRTPAEAFRRYVEELASPEKLEFIKEYGQYIDWESYAAAEEPDVFLATVGATTYVFAE